MRKILALLIVMTSLSAFGQLDTVDLSIYDFGIPARDATHPDFMRGEAWKMNQGFRSVDSLNNVIDVTDSTAVFTTIDVDSTVTAVLDYEPPHGSMVFADSAAVIALTQNVWAKITNAANDLYTVVDADGITVAGDTITVITPGDYVIWVGLSFEGGPSDVFHIAIYKNFAITPFEMHRKTANADTGNAAMNGLLDNLAAGDDISIYIRNTGDNDDATLVSSQVTIFMIHPR